MSASEENPATQVLNPTDHEGRLVRETVKQLGPAYSAEHVTPVLNQTAAVHELASVPGSETSWSEALGYSDQVTNSGSFFGQFKQWLTKRHPGQEIIEDHGSK